MTIAYIMNVLSELLSSKTRAKILHLLFDGTDKKLHMRELERQSGCSIGTIQAELAKLSRLGLVIRRQDGNRVYYNADPNNVIYPDLKSIVYKTSGLMNILREKLSRNTDIEMAFIFGSFARGEEKAGSDVDLMILGSIGLRQLAEVLSGTAEKIGREINPHIMSIQEFTSRKTEKDHFVSSLLSTPKIFLKGSQNEFEKLG